jgi:hypothetical protein
MLLPPLGFVQSLVRLAEQTGDVTQLVLWRDELLARMRAGEGKVLVNASANGKAYGYWMTMSVELTFHSVVKAIDTYNEEEGSGPITFLDFGSC